MSPSLPWPLNRFRNPRPVARGTIEAIYGMIVAQAREPAFYRDAGVPDTVSGRFDMVLLHLWAVLGRLKTAPDGKALSQALFDRFCADMDANLREMGVGDLTVPKRMKAFGEAFYGRAAAYDMALSEGRAALAQAIGKNVLNGEKPEQARALSDYVAAARDQLAAMESAEVAAGDWRFPRPGPFLAATAQGDAR